VTPQKPRLAVPTLQEAVAARDTSDEDVDQQLVGELAGDESLPGVPLPNASLSEARPDGSVRVERTSPASVQEAKGVVFGLRSGSCLVWFI